MTFFNRLAARSITMAHIGLAAQAILPLLLLLGSCSDVKSNLLCINSTYQQAITNTNINSRCSISFDVSMKPKGPCHVTSQDAVDHFDSTRTCQLNEKILTCVCDWDYCNNLDSVKRWKMIFWATGYTMMDRDVVNIIKCAKRFISRVTNLPPFPPSAAIETTTETMASITHSTTKYVLPTSATSSTRHTVPSTTSQENDNSTKLNTQTSQWISSSRSIATEKTISTTATSPSSSIPSIRSSVCDVTDLVTDMPDLDREINDFEDEMSKIQGIPAGKIAENCAGMTEWSSSKLNIVFIESDFKQTDFKQLFGSVRKMSNLSLVVHYNDHLTDLDFGNLTDISADPFPSFNFTDCPYVESISLLNLNMSLGLRIHINGLFALHRNVTDDLKANWTNVTNLDVPEEPNNATKEPETYDDDSHPETRITWENSTELLVAGGVLLACFLVGVVVLLITQKKD